jgi:phosphoribosylformylglycinamidine (FGAM) synthase PurS component
VIHRIEIATRRGLRDGRGEHVAGQIRDFLHIDVAGVRTRDVYHLEADLDGDELERVVRELADPVQQLGAVGRVEDGPFDVAIAIAYKPGVADPVGKSALVAIQDTLGRPLGSGAAVYTSVLYLLDGVDRAAAERITADLLANPAIQTARIQTRTEWRASPPDLSVPKVAGGQPPAARAVDLSGGAEELRQISQRGHLALSVMEMETIRDHFRQAAAEPRRAAAGLGDAPTDVELECLAQTWSEHCKHKIFNATISYREDGGEPRTIHSLFDTYIRGLTREIDRRLVARDGRSWLVSVPSTTRSTSFTKWRPTTRPPPWIPTAAPSPASWVSTATRSAPAAAPICWSTSGDTASPRRSSTASCRRGCCTRSECATASTVG